MIFLDTNVISETFRQEPSEAVISWVASFESELATSTVVANASITGKPISAPDDMIAAIAKANRGKLATRNTRHFEHTGLELINPWDH